MNIGGFDRKITNSFNDKLLGANTSLHQNLRQGTRQVRKSLTLANLDQSESSFSLGNAAEKHIVIKEDVEYFNDSQNDVSMSAPLNLPVGDTRNSPEQNSVVQHASIQNDSSDRKLDINELSSPHNVKE